MMMRFRSSKSKKRWRCVKKVCSFVFIFGLLGSIYYYFYIAKQVHNIQFTQTQKEQQQQQQQQHIQSTSRKPSPSPPSSLPSPPPPPPSSSSLYGLPTNLQECIDAYTSRGYWNKGQWKLSTSTTKNGNDDNRLTLLYSNCQFHQNESIDLNNTQILKILSSIKIGFMGDSTTRSDIRALEEVFGWKRTNLDESQVFQKKEKGQYICHPEEQSYNLTKCGIPPIIKTRNIRYFYKIYPWSPLDEWYFEREKKLKEGGTTMTLFQDLDVLVVSIGRWIPFRNENLDEIAKSMGTFLTNLKKVYSGRIIYQSEYGKHLMDVKAIQNNKRLESYQLSKQDDDDNDICPHGLMNHKYDCLHTVPGTIPDHHHVIRSVVIEHGIPYLDRWNISQTLPLEHYQTWLCGKPLFHSWYCDHHLGFVAMQHFRLLVYVIQQQQQQQID